MPRPGRRQRRGTFLGRTGRPARPHARGATTGFEALEPRLPMTANLVGGVWRIYGDGVPGKFDDTIVVERDPADATRLRATVNGAVVDTRREAAVRVVQAFGGKGDDSITLDIPGNTRIRSWLVGGPGNDTIRGGDASDHVVGGPGNDTVDGGGGDDLVEGGEGEDSLLGGKGDDTLRGDGGRDTLRGGAGRNTLFGGTGIDRFFGVQGVDRARLGPGERLVGNESTNPLRTLTTDSDLEAWYYATAMQQWGGRLGAEAPWWPIAYTTRETGVAIAGASPGSADASADHSGTNNQVDGVEEGDLVETDGRSLFVIAGDGVDIVGAGPASALAVTSHVTVAGDERSLFLDGGRLTVISQEQRWVAPGGEEGTQATFSRFAGWWGAGLRWQPAVIVTVIDVADPSLPRIVETTSLDGWLLDAREIDGRLFVVVQDDLDIPAPALVPVEKNGDDPTGGAADGGALTGDGVVPTIAPIDFWPGGGPRYRYEDAASYRVRLEKAWNERALPGYSTTDAAGTTSTGGLVSVDRTYVPAVFRSSQLLSVVQFDLADDTAGPTSSTTVAGITGTVYASTTGLYVAAANWGNWWDSRDRAVTTNIYHFDLEAAGVPLVSMGSVPGTTLDRFSLDEHEGLLRVATTDWTGGVWNVTDSSAGVFVLGETDGNLVTVGAVTNLARGERIYSSRFVGDVAYVSTFRQVDPLFVIDLSNPIKPRVRGELEIPGFSSYLQPLDATHLLGVGRDVDPATGRVLGLQLSVFDVADPARPRRASTYTFAGDGWQSWSSALWDHHALAWFPEQRILTLPVQQGDWWSGSTGLVVFRIDPGADGGFTRLGEIAHSDAVERGVRIGDLLYSVSATEVKVHRLDDPSTEIAGVRLTARGGSAPPAAVL